MVLHLLKDKERLFLPLIQDMNDVVSKVKTCVECGNLDETDICNICNDTLRNKNILCVVETVADLWAMERSNVYNGQYHILGGVLSAIDGINPDQLNINSLVNKIKSKTFSEVIIAISATLDGQTTAHYLADRLDNLDVKVTRLAHGMPVGGELDFLDDGTIAQALKARNEL